MSAARSITIIDPRVGDIAAVVAGLPAGEAVFVLDDSQDGLGQIAALLAGTDGISALHIVGHGSARALVLGNGLVDTAALAAHADDLATIGRHLAPGGDILLYGCNVAAGDAGQAFIDSFGALTHADIAASTDVTGAAALGGNWTLEAHSGAIEAHSLAFAAFHGTLDTINGDGAANVLTGTEGDDTISGFGGNDTISGLGGNDVIDGGTGADDMAGGLGDDIYYVDNAGDTITEAANAGTDLVYATASVVLSANVENATLLGSGAINLVGNALDNVLIGNSGGNLLNGGSGNDYLDGLAGADTLVGGKGDDTYVLSAVSDVVIESEFEGTDTIRAGFSYALGKNIENLVFTGTGDYAGVGNILGNVMTGNDGNNILSGEDGNDTLYGGNGTDTLIGGTSNDILDGGAGGDAMIGGTGNDSYTVDSIGDLIVENADEGADSVTASVSYTLVDNVENLTLTGTADLSGTGNDANNVIVGNDGANTLSGLGGNDTIDGGKGADAMDGGAGNDTYIVDDAGDTVTDSAGTDTVQSSITWVLAASLENVTLTGKAAINATGNAQANVITGNDGDNVIDGGAGADTMIGGAGADTYYVDNSADKAIETAQGGGTDLVIASASFKLTDYADNLTLTGTADLSAGGNVIGNVITGNSGNNVIEGGGGKDTLDGRDGSDLYVVSNTRDGFQGEIQDTGTTGTDEVRLSYTTSGYSVFSDKDTGIERIVIGTGTGAVADSTGTAAVAVSAAKLLNAVIILGNAGSNRITGTAFGDTIDGGLGADALTGGLGDDTYYVDDAKDRVIERALQGYDTVYATVSVKLAKSVEALVLTGSADLYGTGGADNNTITGNLGNNLLDGGKGDDVLIGGAGNDRLIGGQGADTLQGGSGTDVFVFADKPVTGGPVDVIVDFNQGESDRIELDKDAFRGLGRVLGTISADQFWSGTGVTQVHDSTDRLLYDTTTGNLWYDADGYGVAAPILIIQLGTSSHPVLAYTDIALIA